MNGIRFGMWCGDGPVPAAGPRFVIDTGGAIGDLGGLCVVAPSAGAERIDRLLAAGAVQVLLGEAAMDDAALVGGAIQRHGPDRIGIWARVRRGASHWQLDKTSNADFTVVAMVNPLPRWLLLREDGSLTDIDAQWWAGEMAARGCATVLVSVDAPQDEDLSACAEMADAIGERFWLSTDSSDVDELRFWVRYGQARNLVLPANCDPERVQAALEQRLAPAAGHSCSA